MSDLIEPHDPIPDCDCRNCACRERDRLRDVLRRVAEHHDSLSKQWGLAGEYDDAKYHEERRNFALFHLTPNDGGQRREHSERPAGAEG